MRGGTIRTRRRSSALLAAFFGAGCGPDREPTRATGRPVNVLIVTLDTTRPDHLGPYGNTRVKTPTLDRLAAEGTTFRNAFTPVPSTLPSHCALFTGCYPATTGVHDNALYVLGEEHVTLAELLRERGYATGAFVSAFVLDAQFELDQGFDVYDDSVDLPLMAFDVKQLPAAVPADRRKWEAQLATAYQRRADATTSAALEWLGGLGATPFFLWVHYFDAHQPYQPPPPWDRAFDPGYRGPMDGDPRRFWMLHQQGRATRADVEHMVALYDGEISFLDAWIGRLFDGVRAAGRWDETLVVVVADHGEGFGEHGQLFEHNSEIFDEAMRVPLLIRRPEASARGERTDALARTIDVAPTIVEWLAIEPQAAMQGQSLLAFTAADPAARAAASGPEEVLLEALRERQVNPTPHSFVGLRGADWKLIVTYDEKSSIRKTEFFDLSVDPEEKHPLVDDTSDRAVRLQRRLFDAYWNLPRPARSNARELGALDSDALRALGYTDK